MRTTRLIAAAATIAAMALSATSAQAASFTPNSGQNTTITGTVTWKKAGANPVNCTLTWVRTVSIGHVDQSPACNGYAIAASSPWWVLPQINSDGSRSVRLTYFAGYRPPTPYGTTMLASSPTVPFVEGSGSTSSTIAFNNTQIGVDSAGDSITLTGSVTMKVTGSGGLITIIP